MIERPWALCFTPVSGNASEVKTLVFWPSCPFRGERLIVTDHNKAAFVTDIAINGKSQVLDNFNVPAHKFEDNFQAPRLMYDVCPGGASVIITVFFQRLGIITARLQGFSLGENGCLP